MRRSGFTLMEIVIAISILIVLFGFVAPYGFNFYRHHSLLAERDNLLNVVRRARSEGISHIRESAHGFHIGPTAYTIFQGASYATRDPQYDEIFPRSGGFAVTGPSEGFFDRSGGSTASGTISLTNGSGLAEIHLNYEGRIDW